MTVSNNQTRASYIGDGSSTSFPIPYPFYLATDITVLLGTVKQSSGYSITGGEDASGNPQSGAVIFSTPPATNVAVQFILDVPLTQLVNLVDGTEFPSATLNQVNDRAVQALLRHDDRLSRSITAPDGDVSPSLTLPAAQTRANTYLIFDANGNLSVAQSVPSGTLSQASIGLFLNPRTPAEQAAGIVPVNYAYPPGYVDRYQINTTPGTTNMYAGFQAAINHARKGGGDVIWGATGIYLIGDGTNAASNALDCTFTGSAAQYGITFRQLGTPGVNLPTSTRAGILINHSAYTVFDLTGCSEFKFYDLTLVTNASGVYPKTCFLTARNSTGESNFPRFNNTTVTGYFSVSILYNYASEDGVYIGNNWQNFAHDAGACVVVITALNYFKGSSAFMSSNYTTIFSGSNSCIDHQFIGGQYSAINASATSDLFYLDACQNVKVIGPWLAAFGARSYFYCEMANGPAGHIRLYAVQGENGSGPSYGVLFPNTAGTPSDWVLRDVTWDVTTNSVAALGSTPVIDSLSADNLQETGGGGGIVVPGTLQNHSINFLRVITIGTAGPGWITGSKGNITITTNTGTAIYDRPNSALLVRGNFGANGAAGAAQLVGWGTPTAGAVVNNFPGSGATLGQCGSAITEIILQLKALGIFGA